MSRANVNSSTSLVEHVSGTNFIRIYEDYLQIINGDMCAVALISAMELLSMWERARLGIPAGSKRMPPFMCDMDKIRNTMINMYSVRSIQDAMKVLEQAGFVVVGKKRIGRQNQYIFRHDLVTEAVRKIPIFDDGNFADEGEEPGFPSEILPTYNGKNAEKFPTYNGKNAEKFPMLPYTLNTNNDTNELRSIRTTETVIPKNQEQPLNAEALPAPEASPAPEQNSEHIFVDTNAESLYALWREIFGRDLMALNGKERKWVDEVLVPKFPNLDGLRGKLNEYAGCDIAAKATFPGLQKFLDIPNHRSFRQPSRNQAPAGRYSNGNGGGAAYHHQNPTARPSASVAPNGATLWNDRLPERTWKFWDAKLSSLWGAAHGTLGFDWPSLVEKCVSLAPVKPDINLPWALSHWTDIFNGTYDFLLRKDEPQQKAPMSALDRLIAQGKAAK